MRGLALALARPLKTYGTLDVMARACVCDTPLMIAVDARRDTFYCQAFMANGAAYTQPQALTGAQAVALAAELSAAQEAEHGPQIALCGTGGAILGDASPLFSPLTAAPYPDAVTLAEMAAQDAAWDDLPPAEPLYLRPPDATLPDARKRIQWQS
jgi:tRNA threonylcarbamoyladenosine biosynthesis protein TsaB